MLDHQTTRTPHGRLVSNQLVDGSLRDRPKVDLGHVDAHDARARREIVQADGTDRRAWGLRVRFDKAARLVVKLYIEEHNRVSYRENGRVTYGKNGYTGASHIWKEWVQEACLFNR